MIKLLKTKFYKIKIFKMIMIMNNKMKFKN